MIRTGEQYNDSIRDSRVVYVNRERVKDVTIHPRFTPLIDVSARVYDMQHKAVTRDIMTFEQDGEVNSIGNALPYTQEDWWEERRATDRLMEYISGIVTRAGDETIVEMWSRYDGQDVLKCLESQKRSKKCQ
jgi:4-hydroxyphenylacetate 3-monooxygenase